MALRSPFQQALDWRRIPRARKSQLPRSGRKPKPTARCRSNTHWASVRHQGVGLGVRLAALAARRGSGYVRETQLKSRRSGWEARPAFASLIRSPRRSEVGPIKPHNAVELRESTTRRKRVSVADRGTEGGASRLPQPQLQDAESQVLVIACDESLLSRSSSHRVAPFEQQRVFVWVPRSARIRFLVLRQQPRRLRSAGFEQQQHSFPTTRQRQAPPVTSAGASTAHPAMSTITVRLRNRLWRAKFTFGRVLAIEGVLERQNKRKGFTPLI